jgi:site-specific recombinase XerD
MLARNHKVETLTQQQLMSYFLFLVNHRHYSESLLNMAINAIKFYYEEVLHHPQMFFDIPRPKRPYSLPNILVSKEVSRILQVLEGNLKHQTILMTGYSAGLRVSEMVNCSLREIIYV